MWSKRLFAAALAVQSSAAAVSKERDDAQCTKTTVAILWVCIDMRECWSILIVA